MVLGRASALPVNLPPSFSRPFTPLGRVGFASYSSWCARLLFSSFPSALERIGLMVAGLGGRGAQLGLREVGRAEDCRAAQEDPGTPH